MLAGISANSTALAILTLTGGVALLLWSAAFVKQAVLEGFDGELGSRIARAAAGRWSSLLLGIGIACGLQSSLGAVVLVNSLLEAGVFGLAVALTMVIGADLGVALVIQLFSIGPALLAPILILAGSLLPRLSHRHARDAANLAMGLGFILLALTMIVGASHPLRGSVVIRQVLALVGRDIALGLVTGALSTWLLHSSVASLLLISATAGAGAVGLEGALALMVGANIGAGLIPLSLFGRAPAASRCVILANLCFRTGTAVLLSPAIAPLAAGLTPSRVNHGMIVLACHLAFNLVLVATFLPLIELLCPLLRRLLPHGSIKAEGYPGTADQKAAVLSPPPDLWSNPVGRKARPRRPGVPPAILRRSGKDRS